MVFKDRQEAAILLAQKISLLKLGDVIVLGIPRGGVITAKLISDALRAPLDIIVCRKLGVPGHEELGFGAIAPQETLVLNESVVRSLNITKDVILAVKEVEEKELKRRMELYRKNIDYSNLRGKNVIIVDDGIATGVTIKAALEFVKNQNPNTIIVASPVCAADTASDLKKIANTIFLSEPKYFYAVGQFYQDFPQVSDEEVINAFKNSN